jgi:hypothetical protein
MTHTPGPWINDGGLVNGLETRDRFAPGVSLDIFNANDWPAELSEEAHSNAALIAAAPAMYDLIEQMVRGHWTDDHGHPVRLNDQMAALIPLITIGTFESLEAAMDARKNVETYVCQLSNGVSL